MYRPAPGDTEILRLAASFVNLRTTDFAELLNKGLRATQHRLKKLRLDDNGGLGYFYADTKDPANPFRNVLRLTQKGWDTAHRLGVLDVEVNANREKSENQLEHDLVLTDLHKALHFVFKDILKWSQLYQTRYTRWDSGRDDYVNADAAFSIVKPDGNKVMLFVEVENQRGVEEPLRKMRGYQRFAESGEFAKHFEHPDFRVIFLKPTPVMATNVLTAAAGDTNLATRRFWISDFDSATKRVTEAVFRTPRDFEKTSYSLLFV